MGRLDSHVSRVVIAAVVVAVIAGCSANLVSVRLQQTLLLSRAIAPRAGGALPGPTITLTGALMAGRSSPCSG